MKEKANTLSVNDTVGMISVLVKQILGSINQRDELLKSGHPIAKKLSKTHMKGNIHRLDSIIELAQEAKSKLEEEK